jgi:hypothetical protein
MAREPVPAACPGQPVPRVLPAGSSLFRVHRLHPTRHVGAYNHQPPTADQPGGRFDTLDRSIGHFYAGLSVEGAVAEALLRDDRRPTAVVREIRKPQLRGLVLSRFLAPHDLPLVSLAGPDLGQVGQDVWLTKCEPDLYPETQPWGAAIRSWCEWAVGFAWRGRLNENEFACVLYAAGSPSAPLDPAEVSLPLDSGVGLELVRAVLLPHAVTISDA